MPKHTPEPWGLDPDTRMFYQKHQIHARHGEHWVQLSPEDFERAAACVNACKGIPSKKLEDLAPAGLMQLPAFELLGVMRVEHGPTTSEHLLEPKKKPIIHDGCFAPHRYHQCRDGSIDSSACSSPISYVEELENSFLINYHRSETLQVSREAFFAEQRADQV